MSTNRNGGNDREDLDLDFTAFGSDAPEPAHPPAHDHDQGHDQGLGDWDGDPFPMEGMPGPTPPARQGASSRDHFGDLDGSSPRGGRGHEPEALGLGDFDNEFGIPPDEVDGPDPARAPAVRLGKDEVRSAPRALPRAAEPARHHEDASDDGFGGQDDGFGGHDDGFGGQGYGDADDGPGAHGAYAAGDDHGMDESGHADDRRGDDPDRDGDFDGHGEEDGQSEEAAGSRFEPKRYVFHAAAAGVALLVGVVGWSYLGDVGSAPEQVRGGNLAAVPPRPPGGRGAQAPIDGMRAPPGPPAQGMPPMPPIANRVPSAVPAGSQAAMPPMPPMPPVPPAVQPTTVGAVTAPPQAGAIATRPDAGLQTRVDQLEASLRQLDAPELVRKIRALEDRLSAAETRNVPQAPRPESSVPLKPQLISGYSLQGYFKGTAWIQRPDGSTVEAREGTDLGAGGVVTGVQRYAKEFVVVTTAGVIMRN